MAETERELLLLRHGRAESVGGADLDRALVDPGKRDIQRVGVHLHAQGWLPDAVVASPAVRAQVTAEKVLKAGGRGTASLQIDARIYEATLQPLLELLAGFEEGPARVMLVGHNPGVSELVAFLARKHAVLDPGMLARLAMPSSWSSLDSGSARLVELVDPADLPEGFPFPGPGGEERRSRPAYYYNQSGVVPYRQTDAGLQILIIGSSKRKRWVMPKGIVTPGLTPQESAAKEAREEAGIEGEVGGPSLGAFAYEKWGAQASCEFYPMRVTTVYDESDWEERHRGRQWVSPEVAINTLGREGLKEMVRALTARLSERE